MKINEGVEVANHLLAAASCGSLGCPGETREETVLSNRRQGGGAQARAGRWGRTPGLRVVGAGPESCGPRHTYFRVCSRRSNSSCFPAARLATKGLDEFQSV